MMALKVTVELYRFKFKFSDELANKKSVLKRDIEVIHLENESFFPIFMIQFLSRKQQTKSVNDNKIANTESLPLLFSLSSVAVLFSSQLTISKTLRNENEGKRNFIKCSISQTLCYVWKRERMFPQFFWCRKEDEGERDVSDVIQFLKIYVFCVNNLSYVCISIIFVTSRAPSENKSGDGNLLRGWICE